MLIIEGEKILMSEIHTLSKHKQIKNKEKKKERKKKKRYAEEK